MVYDVYVRNCAAVKVVLEEITKLCAKPTLVKPKRQIIKIMTLEKYLVFIIIYPTS